VGVSHVEFLGHPDGLVESGIPLRRDIAGALRRLRPDVVLTMNFDLTWGDGGSVNHADHRAVGFTVLDACRDAANRWLWPELGEPWAGVHDVYVAHAGRPTHYVDVTATLDAGIASLREHEAYLRGLGGDFDPDEFLRRSTRFDGAAGVDHAITLQHFSV
jgi:LmbE family N-acetylglucosaminyl deacetylase